MAPGDTAVEHTDVLVIGGGQAGIATSEHLLRAGVPHLVLERGRIAERWRSGRWDSLVANGPAWHDRFPTRDFAGDPDAFIGKDGVADYFAAHAGALMSPVRTGVEVQSVRRLHGRPGFRVETSQGVIVACQIVAATGPFQRPVMPALVPETAGLMQIHSAAYRNPAQLPDGAVLVVGAGSSGVQIADELRQSGRRVFLSVGPHGRPPRAYRGRDFCWWLGVLNKWDIEAPPTTDHVTIAVSGANGGKTIDFRRLAGEGMNLVGRTERCANGVLTFAPDLATNIRRGDADYLAVLAEADAFATRNGLDLPEEPEAKVILTDPPCMTDPRLSLDLNAEGVTSIIWATGYTQDYSWLQVDAFDDQGRPRHQRGVSSEPGVYFMGLPWQSRRGSAFIWGCWHDAKFVVDHICKLRGYLAYPAKPQAIAGAA